MARMGALAVVAALAMTGPAQAADPGTMVQRSYTNAAGTRTYFLYVPPGGAAGRPLMVWLHGCGGGLTIEGGHAPAKGAGEQGFAPPHPPQDPAANARPCRNWFPARPHHPGPGEGADIPRDPKAP